MIFWHIFGVVYIGWGNGLLPYGTKPLHEPMMTYHLICYLAFKLGQWNNRNMPKEYFDIILLYKCAVKWYLMYKMIFKFCMWDVKSHVSRTWQKSVKVWGWFDRSTTCSLLLNCGSECWVLSCQRCEGSELWDVNIFYIDMTGNRANSHSTYNFYPVHISVIYLVTMEKCKHFSVQDRLSIISRVNKGESRVKICKEMGLAESTLRGMHSATLLKSCCLFY